jgi:hypothetical protein
MKFLIAAFFFASLFSNQALAISHEATHEEWLESVLYNQRARNLEALGKGQPENVLRPVEDYADFGYVLMSAETNSLHEVEEMRRLIAQNLPTNVKLVILTREELLEETRNTYLQWISGDRLILVTHRTAGNGFWARDSFPVPVVLKDTIDPGLVAAKYFRAFEAHEVISQGVSSRNLFPKNFRFVGGNLIADHEGNCFVVDSSRLFGLDPQDVKDNYGCNHLELLPFRAGIGDVDEVIKPMPGKKMLTNEPSYVSRLQELGYEVLMLPDLQERYRTYVNALVVGNKVFMPSFGVPQDTDAAKVYQSLGYEVIPIRTNTLSDSYLGSVHCQTMAYPKMDVEKLLSNLELKKLN